MSTLSKTIARAGLAYSESAYGLNLFVRESLRAVVAASEQAAEIQRKIQITPPEDGNVEFPVFDPKVGAQIDTLSFTREEYNNLLVTMEMAHSARSTHPEVLLQMSLTHACALWDALFADVVRATILSMPQHLKSKETMTWDEIIEHQLQGSLIDVLAERRVRKIAYSGVREQLTYIKERLGVDLLSNTNVNIEALELIRLKRNAVTHNGARVTAEYAVRVDLPVGQPIDFTEGSAAADRDQLHGSGMALVEGLLAKYCPEEWND
ncbi:hypothetical protein [Clavibacter michiganensis]|uniref:hypothetical protein n=1 Tax=Clavibacter michiganensis TaxID=28447 RepID=UPI0009CDAF9F|nr:hypothetical protein [Clavibacter michiganensis]MBF4636463.1 hypothetical protein [Clavibacter michiganensis subsp. michiganensis]MDO4037892.1 hypothetical protein [Clavibacter michiganensis]MDO4049638.1 hypothetical protein [Clavibacter michiganensis]MDO4062887.1 hypothetical protein [Clavibacter michiganensis]MDO4083960.1 hypothetical protein [Clavibacter michiganensis]